MENENLVIFFLPNAMNPARLCFCIYFFFCLITYNVSWSLSLSKWRFSTWFPLARLMVVGLFLASILKLLWGSIFFLVLLPKDQTSLINKLLTFLSPNSSTSILYLLMDLNYFVLIFRYNSGNMWFADSISFLRIISFHVFVPPLC